MEASRELDTRIALEVMGWTRYISADHSQSTISALRALGIIYAWTDAGGRERGLDLPPWSTEISAAWTICEHLNRAEASQAVWGRFHEALDEKGPVLWGQTASEAALLICERALEAVGAA